MSEPVVAFALHPTTINRVLSVTSAGTLVDRTISDHVLVAWNRSSNTQIGCSFAHQLVSFDMRAQMAVAALSAPVNDISEIMHARLLGGYGIAVGDGDVKSSLTRQSSADVSTGQYAKAMAVLKHMRQMIQKADARSHVGRVLSWMLQWNVVKQCTVPPLLPPVPYPSVAYLLAPHANSVGASICVRVAYNRHHAVMSATPDYDTNEPSMNANTTRIIYMSSSRHTLLRACGWQPVDSDYSPVVDEYNRQCMDGVISVVNDMLAAGGRRLVTRAAALALSQLRADKAVHILMSATSASLAGDAATTVEQCRLVAMTIVAFAQTNTDQSSNIWQQLCEQTRQSLSDAYLIACLEFLLGRCASMCKHCYVITPVSLSSTVANGQ
jgi:hypothetical protein